MALRKTKTPIVTDPLSDALYDSANALTFFAQAAEELDQATEALDAVILAEQEAIAAKVVRIDAAREQQKRNQIVSTNINNLFTTTQESTNV